MCKHEEKEWDTRVELFWCPYCKMYLDHQLPKKESFQERDWATHTIINGMRWYDRNHFMKTNY